MISDKLGYLFDRVETANNVLERTWDELDIALSNRHKNPETALHVAVEAKTVIDLITDILFDVCLNYALMTGKDFKGVKPHMKSMERVTLLKSAEALHKELYQRMEEVDGRRRAEYRDMIREAMSLSDAEALSKLENLKATYLR